MKTVNERDLIDVLDGNGLDELTGEGCNLSMRMVCDVNEHWQEVINSFFATAVEFVPAYNHAGNWRSIMLPRSIFHDLFVYEQVYWGKKVIVFVGGEYTDKYWSSSYFRIYDNLTEFELDRVENPTLFERGYRLYCASAHPHYNGNNIRAF